MTSISIDGNGIDGEVGVYTGTTVTNLTLVAQDSDTAGYGYGRSTATFNATAGVSYQIAVDGYHGNQGSIILTIVRGQLEPVPNDNFARRITISGASATVYGYNFNATRETNEPNLPYYLGDLASVWWTWKAPATGTVTMSTRWEVHF